MLGLASVIVTVVPNRSSPARRLNCSPILIPSTVILAEATVTLMLREPASAIAWSWSPRDLAISAADIDLPTRRVSVTFHW